MQFRGGHTLGRPGQGGEPWPRRWHIAKGGRTVEEGLQKVEWSWHV